MSRRRRPEGPAQAGRAAEVVLEEHPDAHEEETGDGGCDESGHGSNFALHGFLPPVAVKSPPADFLPYWRHGTLQRGRRGPPAPGDVRARRRHRGLRRRPHRRRRPPHRLPGLLGAAGRAGADAQRDLDHHLARPGRRRGRRPGGRAGLRLRPAALREAARRLPPRARARRVGALRVLRRVPARRGRPARRPLLHHPLAAHRRARSGASPTRPSIPTCCSSRTTG